jgi:hypothetical protein
MLIVISSGLFSVLGSISCLKKVIHSNGVAKKECPKKGHEKGHSSCEFLGCVKNTCSDECPCDDMQLI